ncbi:DUF4188 domain-containing protein [Isoptericola croceus]|uniref:DUF4188 domain-containing protein n=1 Tax=Isoptericola croceus TaxID=3031406 RepID=UPI0023F884AB|nr:DUF4188 domain-containing protein [Isoptericola croceus]
MVDLTTHDHDGDLAVFLIGARINKLWRPDGWWPALAAMGPMLRELYRDPDTGFLGATTLVGLRGPTVVQYWRSVDDIYAYANDGGREHRPAWVEFYRRARRVPGTVGVWHETFSVPAGGHESLYMDVARPIGLAAATGVVPAAHRGRTARERMHHQPERGE